MAATACVLAVLVGITVAIARHAAVGGASGALANNGFNDEQWQHNASYTALALATTTSVWPLVQQQLVYLTPRSLPTDIDGVLALRDAVWRLRSLLDVFWFAYVCEPSGSKKDDRLSDLRASLDDGYQVLGDFKDLHAMGVAYSHVELVQRRAAALDWKASFLLDSEQRNFSTFLYTYPVTSTAVISCRGRDAPSDQFWGALPSFQWPTATTPMDTPQSGLRWLVRLQDGVTIGLLLQLNSLRAMNVSGMLASSDVHQTMHDYRKLLRTLVWMPTQLFSVGLLYSNEADALRDLKTAGELMALMETLNNALNAYEFDSSHYEDPAPTRARAIDAWAAMESFFAHTDMAAVFTRMHTELDTSAEIGWR